MFFSSANCLRNTEVQLSQADFSVNGRVRIDARIRCTARKRATQRPFVLRAELYYSIHVHELPPAREEEQRLAPPAFVDPRAGLLRALGRNPPEHLGDP